MKLRTVVAALAPVAAASALAALPLSGVTPAAPHTGLGRMTPAIQDPLAYRYVGHTKGTATLFPCQQTGASPNCYTPQELATAYDIPASLTGAGQTIVIVDAFGDPTITQDLGVFDTAFGLPPAKLNIFYPSGQPAFDPTNADEITWTGEIALDVESAHAVAPGATIDLVVAKSDSDPDILAAEQYAVRHRLGSVLSQSYGEAESCEAASVRNADHLLYERAAAEGISVFASAGDQGAAQPTCDATSYFKSVSLPAADPYVTSVGGTSLMAAQPTGTYESETAWNDEYGASGGGFSQIYARPYYQGRSREREFGRGVPDVAYSADVNNGLLIAWSMGNPSDVGNIYVFGGTSAGSPQWAAITALADQAAHHRLGFLNPALYEIAHSRWSSQVFHDITSGNNSVSIENASGATVTITGYAASRGWDPVTGLGTPNVAHLINVLG